MENLEWARDHCNGRVKVIVAIAKDINVSPRSIRECFPSKMVMKIVDFNAESGALLAEAEG